MGSSGTTTAEDTSDKNIVKIIMNLSSIRSPLGLLKIVLMALLLSIVILSYIGNEGGRLFFGLGDFLGVGTSVGFAIVIPLIFITYLGDGNILVFESLLSILGAFLFLLISYTTHTSYSHPEYGSPAGKVLAGLCVATGVVSAGNFVILCCNLRGY